MSRALRLWVARRGNALEDTANSPARLAELEAHLRDVAPDAVERDRHTERLSPDPGDRTCRTVIVESYFLDTSSAAEADESTDQMSRNAEASWLATPGVIGDLSPRDAAAGDHTILRQAQRARRPTNSLMSPHRLRDALALDHTS